MCLSVCVCVCVCIDIFSINLQRSSRDLRYLIEKRDFFAINMLLISHVETNSIHVPLFLLSLLYSFFSLALYFLFTSLSFTPFIPFSLCFSLFSFRLSFSHSIFISIPSFSILSIFSLSTSSLSILSLSLVYKATIDHAGRKLMHSPYYLCERLVRLRLMEKPQDRKCDRCLLCSTSCDANHRKHSSHTRIAKMREKEIISLEFIPVKGKKKTKFLSILEKCNFHLL